ncbi:hypothetical protein pdul_cds_254 [Pandoravirus dulcis]|uniref:Uncharacterized protein n=1 Tax=Pandoravirus dulcis TaxID=1349409 RepID=S4VPI5_9VIRU|nr:hypothetical protein pdul_cds_254 [Pandoravirus dulcis]AGO82218.1 hypothetical protein pdul_cds_254 [Pandoravirus dulcis]
MKTTTTATAEAAAATAVHAFGNLPRLNPAYGDCLVRVRHVAVNATVPEDDCFVLAHRSALATLPYFCALFERDGFVDLINERSERQAPCLQDERPWRGMPIVPMVTRKDAPKGQGAVEVGALPDYYAVYEVTVPFCPRAVLDAITLVYANGRDERQTADPLRLSPRTDSKDDPAPRTVNRVRVPAERLPVRDRDDAVDDGTALGSAVAPRDDDNDKDDKHDDTSEVKESSFGGALEAIDRALSVVAARLFFGAPHASVFGGLFRKVLSRSLKARANRDCARAAGDGSADRGPLGQLLCDVLAAGGVGLHVKTSLIQRCWSLLDSDECEAVAHVCPDIVAAAESGALAVYQPGAYESVNRVCLGDDVATQRRRPGRSDNGTPQMVAADIEWRVGYYGDPWTDIVYLFQQPRAKHPKQRHARLSGWVYHPLLGRRRLLHPTYVRGDKTPIDNNEWDRAKRAASDQGVFAVPGPAMKEYCRPAAVYPSMSFYVDDALVCDGALLAFEFVFDRVDAPSP